MASKFRDPVSSLTHLIMGIVFIPVGIILIICGILFGTSWHVLSYSIFVASLLLLYFASGFYHRYIGSEKTQQIFRKIDHMMIYILIAGTYTPICLIPLRESGFWGYALLIIIWSVAILGILFKAFWINSPAWVSSVMYISMGWTVVIAFYPLLQVVKMSTFAFLLSGGIAYTIGGVIYGIKRPKFAAKYFSFHDLFHIFVMIGSIMHMCCMFTIL